MIAAQKKATPRESQVKSCHIAHPHLRLRFGVTLSLRRQHLSRYELITPLGPLLHLFPVHSANIQPKPHPPSRSNIGGYIETLRISLDQRSVVSWKDLAPHAHNSITMMV